ncbi:MAG: hypothetical protein P4M15_12315 [Alphaproteobacteria bacterium]|nr:hypothetical protein [Alphaproteobacteria bacterium]
MGEDLGMGVAGKRGGASHVSAGSIVRAGLVVTAFAGILGVSSWALAQEERHFDAAKQELTQRLMQGEGKNVRVLADSSGKYTCFVIPDRPKTLCVNSTEADFSSLTQQ